MQSHTESVQTLHLFCLYQNQDFSANLSHKQYCVHYLLALEAYEPSFDKGFSTRKLIFP